MTVGGRAQSEAATETAARAVCWHCGVVGGMVRHDGFSVRFNECASVSETENRIVGGWRVSADVGVGSVDKSLRQ